MNQELQEEKLKELLCTEIIGHDILCFKSLDSTNAYCRKAGRIFPHGTVVTAETQTAGRGSRGRSWESPKGVAVYMSLVLQPEIEPLVAPRLTPVMAISIARALQSMGIDAGIKWPNDIVINGKKLVGILTEMDATVKGIKQVVIGVGINVLNESFPEEIEHRATSLLLETGRKCPREELVAAILNCFEEDYRIFLKTCDLSQLLEQYEQFSVTLGQEVKVLDSQGEYTGYARRIDENGQLWVQKDDGQMVCVFADEVSVRGIYGYV